MTVTVTVYLNKTKLNKKIGKKTIKERMRWLLPEKKELVFAGTLFSEDNPGVSDRYEDASGRSVDDVVEVLKEAGLYKAEVRTDE